MPAAEPEPAQKEEEKGAGGYTQALLARFSVPSARWAGSGAGAGDVYNFFANAVANAVSAGTSHDTSGLIPSDFQGAERATFIAAQRTRLSSVLAALDSEAKSLEREDTIRGSADRSSNGEEGERPTSRLSSWSGMSKSKSDVDFEKIDAESGGEEDDGVRKRKGGGGGGGGGWMPFRWGVGPAEEEQGQSSGLEK